MPTFGEYDERRRNRWFFGGVASAGAAMATHPLDLLKVLLQTQEKALTLPQLVLKVYKEQGILGFYNGISASLLRQFTYTLTRFGIYESLKVYITDNNVNKQLVLACFAGGVGALVGMPGDVTNVRMQNDMRLPPDKRRNYKHAFDGIRRIIKEEGVRSLFKGSTVTVIRGAVVTMSTNVVYDQIKYAFLDAGFADNIGLHLLSSAIAGTIATTATQPIDVIKTRIMNSKPGEFKNIKDVILHTAKQGPLAFFKGFVPSFIRITPHTILLYVIMERLRLHFGYFPPHLVKVPDKTSSQSTNGKDKN